MTESLTINGRTFTSPDACSFGDYGGAGSVGRANIDALLKQYAGHVLDASYGDIRDAERYPTDYGADFVAQVTPEIHLIHCTGSYGSETVYLAEDAPGADDVFSALADYPCLDDEAVSAVETEWEEEAWRGWTRRELYRDLPEDLQERLDALPNDDAAENIQWEAYRFAMDATNTYPVPEHNGVHVDTRAIRDEYARALAAMLDGATRDSLYRARWPRLYAPR